MLNTSTLEELYRHMEWADAAVWTSVLASESGRADRKLRENLYHLHVVQRAFLRVWRNEPRETPYPQFNDAQSLMLWARTYYREALAFLRTLNDDTVSQTIPLPWAGMARQEPGRVPQATSLGETVLQVVLHSLNHRGQVNARLREVGGEPPLVDYIAWVWLGRPPAGWPPETAPEPSAVGSMPA